MLANSGSGYFFQGFNLINSKGLRRFVLIPLAVNLVIFGITFYWLLLQLNDYISQLLGWLPEALAWLEYMVWPVAVVAILIGFSFIFSAIANWLAAPFNGLLAEKVEAKLTGQQDNSGGLSDVFKDIPRTLSREWCKLRYYLPRAIGFFIIMWILPFIGQIIWFLFVSWMMAVQYLDYPFDNHKINFELMRGRLNEHKGQSYSFGITTALFSMIPFVNLIVMPVAICGATALWVDHHKQEMKAQVNTRDTQM
ncbi:sulfate transporter CysZ [Thalassotalea montiporae]